MDKQLIPLSAGTKQGLDVTALSGTALAYFKLIPWAELAACAALIYTVLRIIEMVWAWRKK